MAQLTDQEVLDEGFEIHDHSDKPGGYKTALRFPVQLFFKNGNWKDRHTDLEVTDIKKHYSDKLKTVKDNQNMRFKK
jgi:hypothetical protein